jgi:purine-nucleoside phosphorylase
MATPHNSASPSEIAPVVLMPGDPLRAEYVAQNYLDNAVRVTAVRNMFGFTGTWQGYPVSVMASGMGGPSAGIYSFELFKFYNVETIIRIGTAGGLQSHLEPGDLVFAASASTAYG